MSKSPYVRHSALARLRLQRVGPRIHVNGLATPTEMRYLRDLGFVNSLHNEHHTEKDLERLRKGIGGVRYFHGHAVHKSALEGIIDIAISNSQAFPFHPFPFCKGIK